MDLHELFDGRYLCMFPDGEVVKDDAVSAAKHPNDIRYFNTIKAASAFCKAVNAERPADERITYHRIMNISVLQQKFTY